MKTLTCASLATPLGTIAVTAIDRGICSVSFQEERSNGPRGNQPQFLRDCLRQLQEYFEGKRCRFDSLPLAMAGTDFSQRVWDRLMNVPFGATQTYGELAEEVGDRNAARAVGSALHRNPIAIIVPCHRIVPAGQDLPGEYASGAWRKEWLLEHERA